MVMSQEEGSRFLGVKICLRTMKKCSKGVIPMRLRDRDSVQNQ